MHRSNGKIRKMQVKQVPGSSIYILAQGFSIAIGKMNYIKTREKDHSESLQRNTC